MRDRLLMGRAVRLGVATLLSAGAVGVAASSAGATDITPPFTNISASSGQAYGLSVSLTAANFLTELLNLPPQTISLSPFPLVAGPPWGATPLTYNLIGLRVPGVLSVGALKGSTNGSTGPSGGATSSTSVASVAVLGTLLRTRAVTSHCSVTPTSYTASSSIDGLLINGAPGVLASYPNQDIEIKGVASIILNEQIPTVTSTGVSITVNAIDIKLNAFSDGPDLLGGQIIIGQSQCSESQD